MKSQAKPQPAALTPSKHWQELVLDPATAACIEPGARAFMRKDKHLRGLLKLIVGYSDSAGWHMSISHCNKALEPDRIPTWEEIKEARYEFCPDEVYMAMILPPKAEYVNLHETTMHLHQVPGEGE